MFDTSSIRPIRAYLKPTAEHTFRDACEKIETAIKNSRPNLIDAYRSVSVLALQWTNDNLGISQLTAKLMDVFEHKYRFKTRIFNIPHRNQQGRLLTNIEACRSLLNELQDWVQKNEDDQSLLILYYSGHAEARPPFSQFLLSGDLQSPKIDWNAMRAVFGSTRGHKLLLFDCCNAATTAIGEGFEVEILCASAFESAASASLVHSFANRVIDILDANSPLPIKIAGLNTRLVDDALINVIEATPWYGAVSGQASITLRPQGSKEQVGTKPQAPKFRGRVVITCSFSGSDSKPNYENFENWLASNVLEEIADIQVEAVFEQAQSHIFLLTVPIEVWTMLPDHQAWSFVAFVESHNRLLNQQREPQQGQAQQGQAQQEQGIGQGSGQGSGQLPGQGQG